MRNVIEYMVSLEKKYRTTVMSELRELLGSNSNAASANMKQANV